MNNWTIRKRVATGFGLVICIVLALGAFGLLRLRPISSSANLIVTDCLPGVGAIGEWSANLKENRALIQHYMLTDAGGAKEKIANEIRGNLTRIATLAKDYEKTVTQPTGQKMFAQLQMERAPFDKAFERVLALSGADKGQEAMELFMGHLVPDYEKYLAAIERQVSYNHDLAMSASSQISQAVSSAQRGIWIGLLCAFGSALALAFTIIGSTTRALTEIMGKLEKSTGEVAMSSQNVTSSSLSFAEGASEQAASLEETSASLEEISSMTKRNAENAASCKQLSQQASESAGAGIERITEMGRTLISIKSAVGDMESAVREMQSSSQEISKIIKTIDEIAFQTNLLALNAAVEAARAGEAGMGFAVVADEVRALAQRSAQAAKDTSDKIESAIKRSELGGVASAKVAHNLAQVEGNAHNIEQVFNGIVTQIKSLDEVIREIAAASQEQSSGVTEVNMAVSQMDKVTQSNAATAEENASSAEELHNQVASLRKIVVGLQTIVTGTKTESNDSREELQSRSRTSAKLAGQRGGPQHEVATGHSKKTEVALPANSFKDF